MRGFKQGTKMYCPKCGKENQDDAKFCMHCGADLSGYKVAISPNITVSPYITVPMIDKEQISLLVEDKLSKALEKAHTFKDIQAKEITPEEQQAIDTFLKIAEEARKGGIIFSKYHPQDLERCVKILDTNWEILLENLDKAGKEALLCVKGGILDGLGRYSEALECWDNVLEINPLSDAGWFNKGMTLKNLKRYNEADRCFNKALDINPKYDNAWAAKGDVMCYRLKDFADGKMSNEELGLFEPKTSIKEAFEFLVSKESELEEEARRCINKALEINPQFEWAWIHKSMFEKDRNEKIRCLDKALDINPRSADALCQKGVLKYIQALELVDLFNGCIKREKLPEYKSRLWEAIEFYDKALKIDPNHTQALKEREKLLKELKKHP